MNRIEAKRLRKRTFKSVYPKARPTDIFSCYNCGWIGPIGVYKSCPECKSHFSLVRAGKREGARALVAYRILGLTGKTQDTPSLGSLVRSSTLPELKSALKVIEKTGK